MEHQTFAKDICILSIETEYKANTERVQALLCFFTIWIFVLFIQGIIKDTNDLAGFDGNLHLFFQILITDIN